MTGILKVDKTKIVTYVPDEATTINKSIKEAKKRNYNISINVKEIN